MKAGEIGCFSFASLAFGRSIFPNGNGLFEWNLIATSSILSLTPWLNFLLFTEDMLEGFRLT
jgi:hypothetical protein